MSAMNEAKRLFRILRRRRVLALTVFVLVLVLGALVSYLLPTKYTSYMRILIRATPTDLRATAERADGGTVGQVSEEEVNSEVQVLTSYDLLKEAVLRNQLSSMPPGTYDARSVDAAIRKLVGNLDVTPVRKTNIIEVQYTAKSPQQAASVLRTIEAGYLEAHLRAQSTPGGYRFFQAEMEYYRAKFADTQRAFASFSNSQGAANLEQQVTLLTRTISDQQTALQQAEAQVAELQSEIARSNRLVDNLAPRIDTTQRRIPNQSAVEHFTTLLADLQVRRIQQVSKFQDGDPLVQETDAEIARVNQELANASSLAAYETSTDTNPISQTVQGGVASRSVQLAGLQSKIVALRGQIGSNRSAVNHLTEIAGKYRLLNSDVESAQDQYNNYVQRQENARISENLDRSKISNVVVTQEPTESVLPIASHRRLVVAFSFLAAIFLSICSCLLAEAYRPSLVAEPV